MNLYRIERANGAAVTDFVGPCLYRSASRAKERAKLESYNGPVTVYRIQGAGTIRAMYTVDNGKVSRATQSR